jgi:hypothetical protein
MEMTDRSHNVLMHLDNKSSARNKHVSRANIRLLSEQYSPPPAAHIHKHYKEFQQALYMLKVAVEELWRVELEQLCSYRSKSTEMSQQTFNLQVPSIYSCRSVLPVTSETNYSTRKTSTCEHTSTIDQSRSRPSLDRIQSCHTDLTDRTIDATNQLLLDKSKTLQSRISNSKRKAKQTRPDDDLARDSTKTALLHIKFRCSKHMH